MFIFVEMTLVYRYIIGSCQLSKILWKILESLMDIYMYNFIWLKATKTNLSNWVMGGWYFFMTPYHFIKFKETCKVANSRK